MSRRAITLALSSALILVMALVSAGPAAAASSKAKEKAERARVVKYWNPKRMANATPRDFVKKNGKFVPAKRGGNKPDKGPKNPGGDGGSGDGGTVTGASWNSQGPALNATGKVFFTMGGNNYTCSGAAMSDGPRPSYSVVLTAGHCAFDETNGRFATNWMFKPAYDSDPSGCSEGCYVAKALAVHDGYATSGGFNRAAVEHDWAFAVVMPYGGNQLDGDGVDEFGIAFTTPLKTDKRYSFGYPAQGKYDGTDLVYCSGPVIEDGSYDTWGLECDMTPGSSGGPWMIDFASKSGTLNSVNSYKYRGGPNKAFMFGPKFGPDTKDTRTAAFDYIDGKGVAQINAGPARVGVLVND